MKEESYEYPCDTPGCGNKYLATKTSRRRYCDKCISDRVTSKPRPDHAEETTPDD